MRRRSDGRSGNAGAWNKRAASRRPVGGWIRRRLLVTATIAVAALGLAVVVFAYFKPHKLFIDDRVSEAAPAEQGTALVEGAFEGIAHGTTGTARILELADGSRVLRLEDLATDNGPDLRVYLSTAPAGSEGDAYAEDFVRPRRAQGQSREPELHATGRCRPFALPKRRDLVRALQRGVRRGPAPVAGPPTGCSSGDACDGTGSMWTSAGISSTTTDVDRVIDASCFEIAR